MAPMKHVRESRALDVAYLKRGVPALIDQLAREAIEEVERDRDTGTTDDEAVVSGEAG